MSEQREALAEALSQHAWLSSDERDSRRYESMAEVLHKAVLRAEAAERVAAAVEALADWWQRSSGDGGYDIACRDHARQLRAALTTGAADRARAEAQVDFSRLNYGICPKCGEDKFIGHGPWCIDCFAGGGDQ